MVVGFQADIAAGRQQIFEVELTDESILLVVYDAVLISEVSVEYEAIVQLLAGQQHFYFCIFDTVLAGPDICTELHFVGEAIHDTGYLGGKGG